MLKSESIAKLAEALSKAQGEMSDATKDASNPFFKSKYADLASVRAACRKEFAQNGLAVVQLPTVIEGKLVLEYALLHSSGEYISSGLEMNPTKNDPQGIGSAITYARRYTLAALAGVATEDDDGNSASAKNGNGANSDEPITPDQTAQLLAMITDVGGNIDSFREYMGVGALKDIRKRDWQKAITAIEAKRKRK